MSEFYGRVQGHRGEATRCGSKSSGIWSQVKSWHWSVNTEMKTDEDGDDEVRISTTKLGNSTNLKIYLNGALIEVKRVEK